jgi:hypothetical protein
MQMDVISPNLLLINGAVQFTKYLIRLVEFVSGASIVILVSFG